MKLRPQESVAALRTSTGKGAAMRRILSSILDHGRALEWGSSVALLSLSITFAVPGETMDLRGFAVFKAMGLDDASAGVFLGVVSSGRLVALYINGSWRRSPLLRMIGALLGSTIFSMMAVGFSWPFLSGQSALSSAPGIYTTLALFDALSIYRSGGDVRHAGEVSHV